MPNTTSPLEAITETEKLAAARMKWWGVYLVREKRRLQGIADRVNAQETAQAVGHIPTSPPTLPDPAAFQVAIDSPDPSSPTSGGETPEEMLVRLDAQIAVQDATAELEAEDAETTLAAAGEPAEIAPPVQWADPSPSGRDITPSHTFSPEEPLHRADNTPPPADQAPRPANNPDDDNRHEQIVTGKASVLSDFSDQGEDY